MSAPGRVEALEQQIDVGGLEAGEGRDRSRCPVRRRTVVRGRAACGPSRRSRPACCRRGHRPDALALLQPGEGAAHRVLLPSRGGDDLGDRRALIDKSSRGRQPWYRRFDGRHDDRFCRCQATATAQHGAGGGPRSCGAAAAHLEAALRRHPVPHDLQRHATDPCRLTADFSKPPSHDENPYVPGRAPCCGSEPTFSGGR